MKVGDLVTMSPNSLPSLSASCMQGFVVEITGQKWVKVVWEDGVILKEHREDLKIISKKA
jgi:hypothetical protein